MGGPGGQHYATPSCELLKGWFAQSLQGVLLVAGFSSLLLKKWAEEAADVKKYGNPITRWRTTCGH